MASSNTLLSGSRKAAWAAKRLDSGHLAVLLAMLTAEERNQLAQAMEHPANIPSALQKVLLQELINAVATGPVLAPDADKISAGFVAESDVRRLVRAGVKGQENNVWDKLDHIDSEALAQYLTKEPAVIAAFVLTRLSTVQSAAVLSRLPAPAAAEIIHQITSVQPTINPEIQKNIEESIRQNLFAASTKNQGKAVEILNALDRQTEERILNELENSIPETAAQIRKRQLKFEDLAKLDDTDIKKLLKHIEKERLSAALRGASEQLKNRFFANMPEISEKIIREDMRKIGPIKISEVENAQYEIISSAKKLADNRQISLPEAMDGE